MNLFLKSYAQGSGGGRKATSGSSNSNSGGPSGGVPRNTGARSLGPRTRNAPPSIARLAINAIRNLGSRRPGQ